MVIFHTYGTVYQRVSQSYFQDICAILRVSSTFERETHIIPGSCFA